MKNIILLFWAVWFSVVAASNLADALQQLGILPGGFTFVSGNFGLLKQVTAIHGTPLFMVVLMFAGVIAWEILAAGLFCRAFAKARAASPDMKAAAARAFTVSTALWGALMIASEFFISYGIEATHTALLVASLASYLVVDK